MEKIKRIFGIDDNKTLISFIVMFLAVIIMATIVLLPFATATEDFKGKLLKNKDKKYTSQIDMTGEEMVDISLVEYCKIYIQELERDSDNMALLVCMIVIAIFESLVIVTLITIWTKKPIMTIIFALLSLGAFKLIQFDFEDRNVIPSSKYDWGMANYLTYILGIIIIAGSIWLYILNKKNNKHLQNTTTH